MKPFMQGKMDGMCGVYSIINALYYTKIITEIKAERLFTSIIKKETDFFPKAFYEGLNFKGIKILLGNLLEEKKSVHYYRPIKRTVTINKFVNTLEKELSSHKRAAAIIGLGQPMQHWTVVTKIANKKGSRTLYLFDSSLGNVKLPQENLCSIYRHNIPEFDRDIEKVPYLVQVHTNELIIIHKDETSKA